MATAEQARACAQIDQARDPTGHFACTLPAGHDGFHRHGNIGWGIATERTPAPDGVKVYVCVVCGRANEIDLGLPLTFNHCRFTGCSSHLDEDLQPLKSIPYVLGQAVAVRSLALEGALIDLADLHHRTLGGSKKHDPEHRRFWECDCKTCAAVTVLVDSSPLFKAWQASAEAQADA